MKDKRLNSIFSKPRTKLKEKDVSDDKEQAGEEIQNPPTDTATAEAAPEDLADVPVEDVKVKTVLTKNKSAIGSEEFNKEFAKILSEGPVWRSAGSLATKMGVDAVDLVSWMDRVPAICQKPGKEAGVRYYALIERIERAAKHEAEENKKLTRAVVTEEDQNAAVLLHMIYGQYLKVMEKYALRIHDKSKEAFSALADARDRMSAGTMLFHAAIKANPEKMPKI